MTIEFTTAFYIKIIVAFIMVFSLGMSSDVLNSTRHKAKNIWIASVILLWVLNFIFPTK